MSEPRPRRQSIYSGRASRSASGFRGAIDPSSSGAMAAKATAMNIRSAAIPTACAHAALAMVVRPKQPIRQPAASLAE